jgi:BMFP domain-containing protein YqiC
MTNQQANDLFSSLKTYINKVSEGEKTPQEIAASLNTWARESAESLKSKISEEVESQVHKLGFIKREEFDSLAARVAALDGQKTKTVKRSAAKKSAKKAAKKSPAKRSAPAKKVVKKSASRKAK